MFAISVICCLFDFCYFFFRNMSQLLSETGLICKKMYACNRLNLRVQAKTVGKVFLEMCALGCGRKLPFSVSRVCLYL